MSSYAGSENNDFPIKFSALCWDAASNTSEPNPSSAEREHRKKVMKSTRTRVSKACKRCRLRKIKCGGGRPCVRCSEADDVCEYSYQWKKESKEYSRGYIDQLLEQNDRYKRAMRVLYANRRLSIQPDTMVLPSTEGDDVPLVHDILDRLGLLDSRMDINEEEGETSDPCTHPHEAHGKTRAASASMPNLDHVSSPSDTVSDSMPATEPPNYDDYFGNLSQYTPPPDAPTLSNDDLDAIADVVFQIAPAAPQMDETSRAEQGYFGLPNVPQSQVMENQPFYDPALVVPLVGDLWGASNTNDFWIGTKDYSMGPAPFASF
ncbi:hypothetical protein BP5796_03757 [Coleophoma crateriformis]|uniref:Zn(2)-C6 fungal-type domain-containing protein n=1 Tax=Coleophoma crateriformis TaxID=565419 RepID=A0A3D8SGN6_9HELO|nr:hypothetical protein BP5796_03757 [Coleophoma crateriformis]